MDKEKIKEYLQKVVKNFKEHEQLSVSMEDTYGIAFYQSYHVLFCRGLRKIIELLGINHKEEVFLNDGKKYKKTSCVYDGVELFELEIMPTTN